MLISSKFETIASPFASLVRRLLADRVLKRRPHRWWNSSEPLEVRCLLSAVMSATLDNGQLTVTDTDAIGKNNVLTVTVVGSDLVISDATEQFIAAPAGGTLSNGDRTLTIPFNLLTSGLKINAGTGNDLISIAAIDAAFNTNLTVNGDGGSDSVTFQSGAVNVGAGSVNVTAETVHVNTSLMAGGAVDLTSTGDDTLLTIDATLTAGGNSKFTADKMVIQGLVNVGSHVLTLAPESTLDAGDTVDLGSTSDLAGNTLELSDEELDRISAATIIIGDTKTSTITISATIQLTADSGIQVVTGRNILFNVGTSWSTNNGNLTFFANVAGATAGDFYGIVVNHATISSSGAGNILLQAQGGTIPFGHGIWVIDGGVVQSTGTGAITLDGTGGSGNESVGVLIDTSTNDESRITSVNGDITLIGQGGLGSEGAGNRGVFVIGQVQSTGTARIIINGTGGGGTSAARGVELAGINNAVTSQLGDIQITGQGGATEYAFGIWMRYGARIESTGTAKISLNGTGGNNGGKDFGVILAGFGGLGATIASVNGDISIIGMGGDSTTGSYSPGVGFYQGSEVISSGTAAITIDGTGGAGTASGYGVEIADAGTNVTSERGDITITGRGGSSDPSDYTHNLGVLVGHEAVVRSTGTSADAARITIHGTGGFGGGLDVGVWMFHSSSVSSAVGEISIAGQSGTGPGSNNHGVLLESGATIVSTDSAPITIEGTGRGTGGVSVGVYLVEPNSGIKSVNGDINITGEAGDGSGHANIGVTIDLGGYIESTGTAAITIHGTGGDGWTSNHGVRVYGVESFIKSAVGDIDVTGIGGAGTDRTNTGVDLQAGGTIVSTGTAKIHITGTAGTGLFEPALGVGQVGVWFLDAGSGILAHDGDIEIIGIGGGSPASGGNHGVAFQSGSIATSGAAKVLITGTPGVGDASFGIQLQSEAGNTVIDVSAGTGTISLVGDAIHFDTISHPTLVNAGNQVLIIHPKTPGTAINLGANDASEVLGLDNEELQRIVARTLIIGDQTAGDINLSSDITMFLPTNIQLVTGGSISLLGGTLNTSNTTGGKLLLDSGAGVVNPVHAGLDVNALTTILAGDLLIAVNGTAVDSGYTQLRVMGGVNLNGVPLQLAGSYIPNLLESFVIVRIDSGDAVVGEFDGLAEGTIFNFNGRSLRINYAVGNGNDVVLTTVNLPPVAVDGALAATEDALASGTLTATDVDSSSLTYSVATPPEHGTLVITNSASGTYTYTPEADYNGSDSFTFTATDGLLDSSVGTISITVAAVNDTPQLSLNGESVNFSAKAARKDGPTTVLPQLTISDVDQSATAALGGGRLTVSIDLSAKFKKKKIKLHDSIPQLSGQSPLGTSPLRGFQNGRLVYAVDLDASTTIADVQSFLRSITFSTKGPGLKLTPRILQVQLTDAAGATSNILQQTINVTK